MKKAQLILLLFCLSFIGCSKTPSNEIPMYGNVAPTEKVRKINEKFINEVIKDLGSREAAIENGLKLADDIIQGTI